MGYDSASEIKEFIFGEPNNVNRELSMREVNPGTIVIDIPSVFEKIWRYNNDNNKPSVSTLSTKICRYVVNILKMAAGVHRAVLCTEKVRNTTMRALRTAKHKDYDREYVPNHRVLIDLLRQNRMPHDWKKCKFDTDVRLIVYWVVLSKITTDIKIHLKNNGIVGVEVIVDNIQHINFETGNVENVAWKYDKDVESYETPSNQTELELAMLHWAKRRDARYPVVFQTNDTDIIPVLLLDYHLHAVKTYYVYSVLNKNDELYSIADIYDNIGADNITTFLTVTLLKGNNTVWGIVDDIGMGYCFDAYRIYLKWQQNKLATIKPVPNTNLYKFEINYEAFTEFLLLVFKLKYVYIGADKFTSTQLDTMGLYSSAQIRNIDLQKLCTHLQKINRCYPSNKRIVEFLYLAEYCVDTWLNQGKLKEDEEMKLNKKILLHNL